MTVPNTTYRVFLEKLGGSDPSQFVGDAGEVFLDPNIPALKLSDGSTPGGIAIGGTGGGGGGGVGESYWAKTSVGIHTLSNVGIGTTNPTTKLEIGGVLGFSGLSKNVRIGDSNTGANLTSGQQNIFVGAGAGNFTTTGDFNNFIGIEAGQFNTTGNSNNFFGFSGGYKNTTGNSNSFFGDSAGFYNTVGNNNAFFGAYAGVYNTIGNFNTLFGSYTGISTSASNRVIIGRGYEWSPTGYFDAPDTTKDTQFAVGLRTDTNPSKYWLVGNENFNIGIGTTNPQTKLEIGGVLGFGNDFNVRIGNNLTGANLTPGNPISVSGTRNIFIGPGAGNSTTSGYYNNFFGHDAGYYNTTGRNNNFIGRRAGNVNTTGNYNNFFGRNSGYYNTTGVYNNFIGSDAGNFNSTGAYNNFFGALAGYNNTTGRHNSFFGAYAGAANTTGSLNIFLGSYNGLSSAASQRVIIGSGNTTTYDKFDAPDTTKDIQFAVGVRTDANPSKYWLVGNENFNIGIGTTNPTSKLTVQSGDVRIGINTSQGIILTDANGVAWRLFVNTNGTLGTVLV